MFLSWFNTAVGAVSDKIWYLISSPARPTKLHHPTPSVVAEESPLSHELSEPPESSPSLFPLRTSSPSILTQRPISSLFALVIGIDNYKYLNYLHGAVADADAVRTFLQDTLLVPEDRIKSLHNEKATRTTIETEIKNLAINPEVRKDDPILIFYAGHGAEAPAPSGWTSSNGKIQMLAPYEFNPNVSSKEGQGVLDITLSHLLGALAKEKSDNITVILDCCHSGSGTRDHHDDPTFAVRGVELPKTYTIPQDVLRDAENARSTHVPEKYEKANELSHVLLSACKQGEKAIEKNGRGAFTSALLDLLQKKGVDKLTYEGVMTELSLPEQEPQCEGFHRSRFLFNSKVTGPRQGRLYDIRALPGTEGQYILDAGIAHGITKNDELVVFADKTMRSPLGTVVAVETDDFTTTCRSSAGGDTKQQLILATPGWAVQGQVGAGQVFRLFIEPDERLGIFKQIADEMQNNKAGKRGLGLVENRNDADLVAAADGDFVHFEIMNELCQKHGLTRMPFEVKIDDIDSMRRILQSSADFYWYFHRSSKKSRLAEKVKLECTKLTETGKYTDDLEDILEPVKGVNLNDNGVISIDVGEEAMYGYSITNTSNVPLYVSMFYFDISDLSITAYYQPGSAKNDVDASLSGKKSLAIGYGASGTVPHTYTLRKRQDVDVGFSKVFFSMKHIDLSEVVQESPFDGSRTTNVAKPRVLKGWLAMNVAIVQK
ncbi:caspase domain-containing protein [Armillaria novae-zelandiae]|uniref:Caspase domain-containing protein n=1 Tax=Armillaria novae-zelandiae TaxID=153914 RepID=A0AA39NSH8_9AGAR|nr:caspase domain-containing protein [Armillaria novae-zelandiae]